MAEAKKGEGRAIRFIRDHQNYPHGDWCIVWPFSTTRGYGTFGYLGNHYYAHRFMCELAHGPAPSDVHEAAHSCGDTACVNPHHLSWKTPSENGLDNRKHGTHIRSRYGSAGKLTMEQADAIRSQRDTKTLRELADEYGVSESAISNVWTGKTHYRPSKINHWKPEEDAIIRDGVSRGLNFTQLAKLLPGRGVSGVQGRTYRLGLKSGTPCPRPPADRQVTKDIEASQS
jgi:transcriptional regulator with XRE-family HTH domain